MLQCDSFCVNHHTICCKECLAESHRACHKVVSIDVACNGAKHSSPFFDFIYNLVRIVETANKHSQERSTERENATHSKQEVKQSIRKNEGSHYQSRQQTRTMFFLTISTSWKRRLNKRTPLLFHKSMK